MERGGLSFTDQVKVKKLISLTQEKPVPALEMKDKPTFFKNLKSQMAWTCHFRGSPEKMRTPDGEIEEKLVDSALYC